MFSTQDPMNGRHDRSRSFERHDLDEAELQEMPILSRSRKGYRGSPTLPLLVLTFAAMILFRLGAILNPSLPVAEAVPASFGMLPVTSFDGSFVLVSRRDVPEASEPARQGETARAMRVAVLPTELAHDPAATASILDAVARGDVDVAAVDGVLARAYAERSPVTLRVTAIRAEQTDPEPYRTATR